MKPSKTLLIFIVLGAIFMMAHIVLSIICYDITEAGAWALALFWFLMAQYYFHRKDNS